MIVDAFTMLAGNLNAAGALVGSAFLNVAAGSPLATNAAGVVSVDTGSLAIGANQPREMGGGEQLHVAISILAAPTTAGTITFQLVQADDGNLSTNVEVLVQSAPFTAAQLPLGTVVPLPLDRAAPLAPRRFIGLRAVTTAVTSTSSVAAVLVKDYQMVRNLVGRGGFVVV